LAVTNGNELPFLAHRYSLLGGGAGHAVFAKKNPFFRENWVYKFGLCDQTRRKLSVLICEATNSPLMIP
jgi:hypothetical protein